MTTKAAAAAAAAAAAIPCPKVPRIVNQGLARKGQKRKEIVIALARRRAPIVNEILKGARIDQHARATIEKKDEDLRAREKQQSESVT
jgi:hypothetical protein